MTLNPGQASGRGSCRTPLACFAITSNHKNGMACVLVSVSAKFAGVGRFDTKGAVSFWGVVKHQPPGP